MIEIILWLIFPIPMLMLVLGYLLLHGWSKPSEIITVYSEDTCRVDEDGGPYEVKITKD
jgi:hypothetical protein